MTGTDKDIIEASGYAYIKERDKFKDVLKPKIYSSAFDSSAFDLSVKVGIDYGNGKDVTASIIGFTNSKGQFIILANFDDTTKIGKMIIDELDKMRTKSVDDFKEVNQKALEIIKKKNVSVWGFRNKVFGYQKKQNGNIAVNDTYEYYLNNFGCYHNGFDIELLTEEEFNLLKEVLK